MDQSCLAQEFQQAIALGAEGQPPNGGAVTHEAKRSLSPARGPLRFGLMREPSSCT